MKLIIDIPEVVKHKVYAYGLSLSPSDKEQLINAIMNSIPLDNLRAEIDEIPLSEPMVSRDGLYCYGSRSITMGHFREKVLEIIDKYKEGEKK